MGKRKPQYTKTNNGIRVQLTKNKEALIDEADLPKIEPFLWCASEQGKHRRYYAISRSKGPKVWMHRLIMDCPASHVVDHINGDGLDNRRSNLRIVLYEENQKYAAHKTNSRPKALVKEEPFL